MLLSKDSILIRKDGNLKEVIMVYSVLFCTALFAKIYASFMFLNNAQISKYLNLVVM